MTLIELVLPSPSYSCFLTLGPERITPGSRPVKLKLLNLLNWGGFGFGNLLATFCPISSSELALHSLRDTEAGVCKLLSLKR